MKKMLKYFCFILFTLLLLNSCSNPKLENPFDVNADFDKDVILEVDYLGNNSINLYWNDPYSNEYNFILEQKTGSLWEPIVTLNQNVTQFQLDILPTTNYNFRILVVFDDAVHICSNVINYPNLTTVSDINGNMYDVVAIGNQVWMAENLKVTKYRNGDPIPHVTDNETWDDLSSGGYCVYDNNPLNTDIYGNLYNWYAANDSRGLAPEGWHIPTDEEIIELEMYLGMSQSQLNGIGWRGTNEGSKLAGNETLWYDGELENDTEFGNSDFDFLPGGMRGGSSGVYFGIGGIGYFLTNTEYDNSNIWFRHINYSYKMVNREYYPKSCGFSVRCIKD